MKSYNKKLCFKLVNFSACFGNTYTKLVNFVLYSVLMY